MKSYCKKCGEPLTEEGVFCPECGHRSKVKKRPQKKTKKKEKIRLPKITISILIFLLVLSIAINCITYVRYDKNMNNVIIEHNTKVEELKKFKEYNERLFGELKDMHEDLTRIAPMLDNCREDLKNVGVSLAREQRKLSLCLSRT